METTAIAGIWRKTTLEEGQTDPICSWIRGRSEPGRPPIEVIGTSFHTLKTLLTSRCISFFKQWMLYLFSAFRMGLSDTLWRRLTAYWQLNVQREWSSKNHLITCIRESIMGFIWQPGCMVAMRDAQRTSRNCPTRSSVDVPVLQLGGSSAEHERSFSKGSPNCNGNDNAKHIETNGGVEIWKRDRISTCSSSTETSELVDEV